MKILADECIHRDLLEALEKEGFGILSVRDVERGASDERVFELAKESERVLLTFGRGFGDIFRFDIGNSYGVVIVLIGKLIKESRLDPKIKKILQAVRGDAPFSGAIDKTGASKSREEKSLDELRGMLGRYPVGSLERKVVEEEIEKLRVKN